MKEAFKTIIARVKGMGLTKQDISNSKGKKEKDKEKLTPEDYANIIVVIARCLNYEFCSFEGDVMYIFVNTHWQKIPNYDLKVFLKECLCSLLNDNVRGSKRKDVDDLIKQFPYTIMSLNVQPAKNKINFLNGTLDLVGRKFEQHNPKDYIRYVLPYCFDKQATCPMFMKYLNRVVPDVEVQMVLAEYVSWIFTDIKLEKAMFLYGSGCNGKSVFIDIVEALVGKENVCHESITDMYGENGDNHRSNIIRKLLNTSSDIAPLVLHGDLFKSMISGESISTKQNVTSTTDYAKMLFSLNELPKKNDLASDYYRQLLIVPFNVQIPKSEIDPYLAKKIINDELPGIMNWVLKGYVRLIQNQKFSDSKLIDSILDDYK